ncbi:hypothetical protein GCM10027258_10500 [Amycolatopsis stemonae]
MADDKADFIEGDEVILRRCPNKIPDFLNPFDLVTKQPKMETYAVRLKDNEDGLSCYREALLERNGQSAVSASKKRTCYVFSFLARVVREVSGVVQQWDVIPDPLEDQEDEEETIGHAHALVTPHRGFRYAASGQTKKDFTKVRHAIIANARAVYCPVA